VVALALAAVILYFSAWPTLLCTLPPERGDGVDCAISAKVLNLVPVVEARVTGVRAAAMVASATDRSRTPPRLMFVTADGSEDLGYFSQRFAADWVTIDAFARNATTPEIRLATPLTVRTVVAHVVTFVLILIGASTIVSVLLR
jgi:hypothetical protein